MRKNSGKFSANEYSAQRELARIRNTFSFRFGVLVTESFVRKPWLFLLFPFRFLGLFLHKPDPQTIEYKNKNGTETYVLFSTSEEGIASVERALHRGNELKEQGFNVVQVCSSRQGSIILENFNLYSLTDPKNKTAVKSTTEWNETCLNFLHQIVMGNNVTTLEFDGPYPYRGLLNLVKIHPHIKTVWRRLSSKPPTNSDHQKMFDRIEYIDLNIHDFTRPKMPVVFGNEEPKSILMALGYDQREGVAKGTNAILQQLKRQGRHQVIVYNHLQISNKALSPLPVVKWVTSSNKLLNENIQFAIIPPEPFLLDCLSKRGIPTIVVCQKHVPMPILTDLRNHGFTQPMSVLFDPDNDELRIAIEPYLKAKLNPPTFIH